MKLHETLEKVASYTPEDILSAVKNGAERTNDEVSGLPALSLAAMLSAPMLGAAAGSMGSAGMGTGLVRGIGASAGIAGGSVLGNSINEKLQSLETVSDLPPDIRNAIGLVSMGLPAAVGGALGYKALRRLTRTKREEMEDIRDSYR